MIFGLYMLFKKFFSYNCITCIQSKSNWDLLKFVMDDFTCEANISWYPFNDLVISVASSNKKSLILHKYKCGGLLAFPGYWRNRVTVGVSVSLTLKFQVSIGLRYNLGYRISKKFSFNLNVIIRVTVGISHWKWLKSKEKKKESNKLICKRNQCTKSSSLTCVLSYPYTHIATISVSYIIIQKKPSHC